MFYHITWLAKVYPISALLLIIFWSQKQSQLSHPTRFFCRDWLFFWGWKKTVSKTLKSWSCRYPPGKTITWDPPNGWKLGKWSSSKTRQECQDGWMVGGICFSHSREGMVINHNFKSMGCLTEPNDVSSCFTNDFLWPSLETDSQQMLCSSCLSSCGSVGTQKLWWHSLCCHRILCKVAS